MEIIDSSNIRARSHNHVKELKDIIDILPDATEISRPLKKYIKANLDIAETYINDLLNEHDDAKHS